jgi:hypothetical protein
MDVTKITGLLGCNAVHFRDSQKFQRNISPPSSRSKNSESKNPAGVGRKFPISCLASRYLPVICFTVISSLAYSSAPILKRHVRPKCWFTFNGLHGIIYMDTEILRTK